MKYLVLISTVLGLFASSSAFAKVTAAHCKVVDSAGFTVAHIPMTKVGEDGQNPAFIGNSRDFAPNLAARAFVMDSDNMGDSTYDPTGSIRTQIEFIDVRGGYIPLGGHHRVLDLVQLAGARQGGDLSSDTYAGFQVNCSVETTN